MIYNANDLAKAKSYYELEDKAWLQFTVMDNELYVRGRFSGWVFEDDWVKPTFHIPWGTMVDLVEYFATEKTEIKVIKQRGEGG